MDFIGDIKVNLKKISVTNKKLNTDYSKDTIKYCNERVFGKNISTMSAQTMKRVVFWFYVKRCLRAGIDWKILIR